MSFLVEIDRDSFPDTAFDKFAPQVPPTNFSLGNAQAMMWMSQLAYETGNRDKIESLLKDRDLELIQFATNDRIFGLPPNSCCSVTAIGHGATIVAFAGTDPLKIQAWITDFTPLRSTDDLHSGFEAAVKSAWPSIKQAIAQRSPAGQPIFFTGHSMGGALALIAADRATLELGATDQTTAVYTFGCPRVGGETFFERYRTGLSESTFRLVHGGDVVADVPLALGGFRHVGRLAQCASGAHFEQDMAIDRSDQNEPNALGLFLLRAKEALDALASMPSIENIGPRLLRSPAEGLPKAVLDHFPVNYFNALSIPLR